MLGYGWQYAVYDLRNGRVLKKFHSSLKLYWVILKTIFPFRDDPLWKLVPYARSMKEKALHSKQIIKSGRIPAELIGNPAFVNELDFEQDKVETLHEYLRGKTTAEAKAIIDKFIAFNLNLLALGVIDKSFNITKNYGVDKDGDIVLIDIGELFDDPRRIREQIGTKVWTKHYVAGCIEDPEARTYFVEQMEKNFTKESDYISRVKALALPENEYMVCGSAILELLGIRKAGDIDLLVSPELFTEFKRRGWQPDPKHPTTLDNPDRTVGVKQSLDFMQENYTLAELLPKAYWHEGIPFMSLETLREAKIQMDREKDRADIKLIDEYIASH